MKNLIGFLALAISCVAFSSLQASSLQAKSSAPVDTAQPGDFTNGPAIWVMADEDTTIYFLGTIHILPEHVKWQTEDLEKIISLADTLVLEVSDADSKAASEEMDALFEQGRQGNNPVPIAQLISPENQPSLRSWAREYGFSMREVNAMQPWFLSFIYEYGEAYQNGADDKLGVENILVTYFEKDKRPVLSLEKPTSGLLGLSQLSDKEQIWPFDQLLTYRRYVEYYNLAEEDSAATVFEQEEAWARGEVKASYYNAMNDTMGDGYYKALITDRNQAWSGWLTNQLGKPGTFLVAVGAAHLAGEGNVLNLLSAKGHNIRRLTKPMLAEALTSITAQAPDQAMNGQIKP